jgi:2-polyprenyl-6-methoxyphenol hydroxylase-like FAD-dependent oxidoreductase
MTPRLSGSLNDQAPDSLPRVHVLGAGPVGLFLAALLQGTGRFSVHLYEKRRDYTRTRMVQLARTIVAGSVEEYCTDYIDAEGVNAIFDPDEIRDALAFRQSIPTDLMSRLQEWTRGFCPLNAIETSLSELIDARTANPIERITTALTTDDALALLRPGDVVVDCTGTKSVLRDQLVPGADVEGANTYRIRLEYALVITFLYGQAYDCNEYCKYYKNIGNSRYKFIPAVNRTYHDGAVSHVTGIVNISTEDYERMPSRFDGAWLRRNFPHVAESMDRFIGKIREETHGEIIGDLEIIRIPLDLYHARHATSREWLRRGGTDHPLAQSPVFLVGDAAMGSPYFQSISLGFECAMFLAERLLRSDASVAEVLEDYQLYAYKQWLRVYMRSKMIKHNKDLLECVGDDYALLEKLHIY